MLPMINAVVSKLAHVFLPKRSNNLRPRLLHPAGLTIVVAVFLLNFSVRGLVRTIPGFILGFASSITIEEVINLTNQERAKSGIGPLIQNPQLSQAALKKAQDMFAADYWAHVSPSGTQPWKFISESGYAYQFAGENLGRDFSDTQGLVNAWMSSQSHKDNIVNATYRDIGVAVVDGSLQGVETRLVIQMFAAPTQVAITKPETPAQPEKLESQVAIAAPQEEPLSQTLLTENQEEELVVEQAVPQFAGTSITQTILDSDSENIIISPMQISQTFGTILVALILGTLVIDWVVAHRKKSVRLVGKNWAHLTYLGAVLVLLLQFAQGRIL